MLQLLEERGVLTVEIIRKQTKRWTDSQTVWQIDGQTDRETGTPIGRMTDRWVARQIR